MIEIWLNRCINAILKYMKDFLHHFFLPRHSNNHRPKILHHQSLSILVISLFMIALLLPSLQRDFPSVLGISNNITVQDLLSLTNQKRQENGLPPLKLDSELSQAAAKKGHDMFTNNYWAHISPEGLTPWVFIKSSGYEYLYAGENLARGFSDTPDVVNAWMESPTHRENMLSKNYNDVGFAILTGTLTGSDTVLVVEEFGSRYIADAPDISEAPQAEADTLSVIPSIPAQPVVRQNEDISPMQINPTSAVAAIQSQPLVDSRFMTKQFAMFLLILFIMIFIIDAIIIERKKIVRVVSHNFDHIIFLTILLLAAIIIGRGLVL